MKKMFGLPLDQVSTYLNLAAVVALPTIAIVLGIVVYLVNEAVTADKDRQLEEYKTSSTVQIAEADKRIAELTAQVEESRKENLKLSLKLEEERRERLKLEKGVSSRSLTMEQRQSIETQSSGVIAIFRLGDYEAKQYATQIGDSLSKSGLTVRFIDIGSVGGNPTGLQVQIADVNSPAIVKLFNAGLEIKASDDGVAGRMLMSPRFTQGFTGPRLFVGLKAPAL